MIERQIIDGQPATVVYFKPGMVPGTKLDHTLVKLIYDNGVVQFLAPRKDVRTADAFDPNEPRDPSGKWTSSGGVGRKGEEQSTVSFVSPNTEVRNLSFSEAEQGLKSPRQKMLAGISQKIDSDLGIKDIRINHVIGAWSDGAENSVMTNSASTDLQVERVAAAAKAFLANQKAVLLFHPDEHGTDFLAQFRITGKLSEIHESLLKAGIEHHTLEPRGPDVVVHVYGSDKETLANVSKAAKSYDAKITVHPGNGEFIGTSKEDGTDAEQRADARAIYEKIISEGVGSAGKLPTEWRSQWENYIDNWERTTGEKIGRVEYRKPKSEPESGGQGGGTSGTGGTAKSDEAQRSAEKAASGKSRLEGLPAQPIKLGDNYYIPAPLKKASDAAEDYMKSAGLEYNPPKQYLPVDAERAERIAKAYDEMKHDPDNPEVKAAYAALAKETMAQWQAIKKTGLKVEWIKAGSSGDPYVEKLDLIRRDVRENNHVWEFPTDLGYGSEGPTDDHNNPMLQPTDEVIDGKKCVVNDIFRIVHDYFGHFKEDVGFSDDGEENAWRSHMAMYSPLARRAATTETRGQASWVNHGPYGNQNYGAEPGDIHYAPQKIGLLPEWCSNEGREDKKTKDKRFRFFHFHTNDGVFTLRLKTKDEFDPNEPRDPSGKWTEGGGSPRKTEEPSTTSAPEEASKPKGLKNSKGSHPGEISTATPTGKGDEYHQPDLATMLKPSEAKKLKTDMELLNNPKGYALTADELKGDPKDVVRKAIDHIKSNLRFLYEQTSDEDKAKTRKWYDGARKLVDEHVEKYKQYGLKDTTVAGVYAALSPNNLWDQNVRNGDKIIDIYFTKQNTDWDDEMTKAADKLKGGVKVVADTIMAKEHKKLSDLTDPIEKGVWIRMYNEAHYDKETWNGKELDYQPFHKISPEGERTGWYLTPKGKIPQAYAWQTKDNMAKAIEILDSKGDPKVISEAMGPGHKIRSFYNNILSPNSENYDVTIDSHAVDAAWLTYNAAIARLHNFGLSPQKKDRPEGWTRGATESKPQGTHGQYGMYAEAHRELAKELGILPRELQSIVWETKRKLFSDLTKYQRTAIDKVWDDYRTGKLTLANAQKEVMKARTAKPPEKKEAA